MAVFTGYCYQRGSCSHSETKKTSYRRARDELGLAVIPYVLVRGPISRIARTGIRRQTFCETTLNPISSVTLGLVTVFDFLA
jgi:hypothetical protein